MSNGDGKTYIQGWGHFNNEQELFAVMDAEIGRQQKHCPGPSYEDIEAVYWLVADLNMSPVQIAKTLGVSKAHVRRILRLLEEYEEE